MKKVILLTFLLIFSFTIHPNCYAKDTASLKNINITELPDSIELNVDSDEPVPYSVIDYSDGSKGVKFVNAKINNSNYPGNKIQLNKKIDIQDASLIQDNQNSVELKLTGESNLTGKKINIHNNVSKSGVIIIEPSQENYYESNNLANNLPSYNFATQKKPVNKSYRLIKPLKSMDKAPISMYSEKQDDSKKDDASNNNQEEKTEQIKDILNLNKSIDTETPSYSPYETSPDLSGYSANKEIAQNNVQDPLKQQSNSTTLSNSSDPLANMKEFVTKNVFAVIGGFACCFIVFIVFILVIASLIKSNQSNAGTDDNSKNQSAANFSDPNIIDNDQINYIPPKTESSSQSVSDAISKIINIKNKKNIP